MKQAARLRQAGPPGPVLTGINSGRTGLRNRTAPGMRDSPRTCHNSQVPAVRASNRSTRITVSRNGGPKRMTLAEAMKLAFAAHARGDLPAAEQLCRAVLDTKADHLDALHLAGAIALQTGRVAEAVDLLSRAVAADPNVARAFINFGLALAGASRWADAVASYDRALALDPGQ